MENVFCVQYLQLPMVLKVPRLNFSPLVFCDRPFSLLGFGDILVPGASSCPDLAWLTSGVLFGLPADQSLRLFVWFSLSTKASWKGISADHTVVHRYVHCSSVWGGLLPVASSLVVSARTKGNAVQITTLEWCVTALN